MRIGAHRLMIASIALTALIVAAAPARAEDTLLVTVPFDFVAGSTQFSAGKYEVRMLENLAVMSIRSADGRQGAFLLVQRAEPREPLSQPELVFDKYETEYRLGTVVFSDYDARQLPMARSASEATVAEVVAVRP